MDENTGENHPFEVDTEDITKNFFKVCCAILNLRPKQRMENILDDEILNDHLNPLIELQKGVGPIGQGT